MTITTTKTATTGERDLRRKPTTRHCEDHPSRAIYECGYCGSDLEHRKHAEQPSDPAELSRNWTARDFDKELDGYPLLSPEGLAAIATDPGYQRRILTCVNSHAILVAALERCVTLLAVATGIGNQSLYGSPVRQRAIEALKQARSGE